MVRTLSETDCRDGILCVNPDILYARTHHDIKLSSLLFLPSLAPCCAQAALPYWAKITGNMYNAGQDDLLVRVIVKTYDAGGVIIETLSDTVAVDRDNRGSFEIKLVEYREITRKYSVDIIEEIA